MKIIAGEFGGRTILGPRDQTTTRPITGRVRTSLFDRLEHRGLLAGQPVIDIFAGTGTLGLEALSRGAGACLFVEQHGEAVTRLKKNRQSLDVTDRTAVLRLDALRLAWLDQLPRPYAEGVSVAFVDPPYKLLAEHGGPGRLRPLLTALARVVAPGGVMSLRLEKQAELGAVEGWPEPEIHRFGSQKLQVFTRGE